MSVFKSICRIASLLLAALLASGAVVAVGAPAQASTVGWRYIRNNVNGKCFDNALENSFKIQIWSCVNGDPNDALPEGGEQQWTLDMATRTIFQIRNRLSGKCIGGRGFGSSEPVAGDSCVGTSQLRWKVIYQNLGPGGWYQVVQNSASGLCLDLTGNSSGNGTLIQEYFCDFAFTNTAQQWRLGENLPFDGGITVPSVVGLREQNASDRLTGAGLVAGRSFRDDCLGDHDVEAQNPSAGAVMSPGTTVQLTISFCSSGGGGR